MGEGHSHCCAVRIREAPVCIVVSTMFRGLPRRWFFTESLGHFVPYVTVLSLLSPVSSTNRYDAGMDSVLNRLCGLGGDPSAYQVPRGIRDVGV